MMKPILFCLILMLPNLTQASGGSLKSTWYSIVPEDKALLCLDMARNDATEFDELLWNKLSLQRRNGLCLDHFSNNQQTIKIFWRSLDKEEKEQLCKDVMPQNQKSCGLFTGGLSSSALAAAPNNVIGALNCPPPVVCQVCSEQPKCPSYQKEDSEKTIYWFVGGLALGCIIVLGRLAIITCLNRARDE